MKKLFSRQSILPDRTNHYDEHGHKVGYYSILCSRCNLGHKMIEYASCCIRPAEFPGAHRTGGIEMQTGNM
jgi:hypothetical protein